MIITEFLNPQLICVALALLIFARFLLKFAHLSGIEKVPGPDYPSWLTGTDIKGHLANALNNFLSGNFKQVFNPSAWEFHEFLAKKCKLDIHIIFGVDSFRTFLRR